MRRHRALRGRRASELKERSASQEHFIDLCRLLGEPTPAEADPTGEAYCFERGARKDTGGDGWADVWKRHHFAWEYKGKRADLDAAFGQLRLYARLSFFSLNCAAMCAVSLTPAALSVQLRVSLNGSIS